MSDVVTRSPGRPREFDLEVVLDRAAVVFAERGYHGTSVAHLAEATGLSAGSLYKAFPDKHAVFLAAVEHQSRHRRLQLDELQSAPPRGIDKLRAVLRHYAGLACGAEGRRGCLVVGMAVERAAVDADIARAVKLHFEQLQSRLAELVVLGQQDGSVDRALAPDDTARFLLSVMQGLRVLGKSSPTTAQTQAAVEVALRALR